MKKVTKEVAQKTKKVSTNLLLGVLAVSIILLAIVVGMLGTNLDNRSDAKGNTNRGPDPVIKTVKGKTPVNVQDRNSNQNTQNKGTVGNPGVKLPDGSVKTGTPGNPGSR